MSDGISPNTLNDISKVYLDQVAAFREIRKQETQKDIERWSQPAKDALQKEEVQVDEEKKSLPKLKMYRKAGNLARAGDEKSMKRQTKMVSVLNKETSKGYKDAALAKLRDGGSPKHQTQEDYKKLPVAKMAKKISDKSFKSGQSGVSTKSAEQTGKMIGVLDTHDPQRSKAKSKIKENFSDWRTELREVSDDVPQTEKEDEKRVTEKKVKNKIVINPKISEAVKEIGGEVLSVEEQTQEIAPPTHGHSEPDHGGAALDAKKKRLQKQKAVLLKRKAQLAAKGVEGISASYDPIEAATDYLYEEGLNEEGIDLLIEEIGLDGFVEFVEGSAVELNEARAARRANVKAKSYAQVKKEVDASDAAKKKAKKGEYAASYAKKETDVTVYDDKAPAKKKAAAKKAPAGMKKAVARKKAVLKQPVKKTAPKAKGGAIVKAQPTAIVKAVSKVKKAQPAKKTTKQGLGSKIRSAYKKGVERHKASVGKAKTEVGKVVKTAKATAKQHSKHRKDFVSGISPTAREKKIAKGVGKAVKKSLTREELELLEKLDYDPMKDPTFDPIEAERTRGVSGKNNPKGGKKLKNLTKEDKAFDNVVKALRKKHGEGSVLTKDSPAPKVNKNTQQKQQRRRAAADEKERRFKKRNPAVTSNRYPKIDQEAWDKAREREKREGIS